MSSIDRRTTFNMEAALYDAVRPRYPGQIFDTIIEVTQLADDARLLEIAPGTGQATRSLAERGYDILAIELGDELTKIGQKAFEQFPKVQFINADFETVEIPESHFDLVYIATAIHWINPDTRFCKPHQLLKENGHMAIIETRHISDDAGDEFFYAAQPIYRKYTSDKTTHLPKLSDIKAYDIDENFFTQKCFKTFIVEVTYSARAHVQLLNTYSQILVMDNESRHAFLSDIETLINQEFEGTITMRYVFALTIGERKTL